MPKRVFWPLALVIMGLIFLASNVGLLPKKFWDLWPLILIVVGLGGLVTSDKEEWDGQPKSTLKRKKRASKKRSKRK
ncbi:MAG: DUF5668 domain-containing protein [Patescibacteria group bacterium]